jgi:hypothetical protein
MRRHEQEIFPLMKRRHLFAEVRNFLLYDFFAPEGYVNEDVFAYSNSTGDERALIIYHNKYASARGWVRTSAAYSVKAAEGDERRLTQKTLGEGLGLTPDHTYFTIFRDHVTGLEYIRNNRELCEKGLFVELEAYKYHVFTDFREVRDNQWQQYAQIATYLNGRGAPSVEDVFKEILLRPIQHAFKELMNANTFRRLTEAWVLKADVKPDQKILEETEEKMVNLLVEAKKFSGGSEEERTIAREVRQKLEVILRLPAISGQLQWIDATDVTKERFWTLLSWLFVHAIGKVVNQKEFSEVSRSWIDEWRLGKTIVTELGELGLDETASWKSVTLIKLLTSHQRWFEEKRAYQVLVSLLKDNEVQQFLQINRYNDILWFNWEAFDDLLWWLMLMAAVEISSDPQRPTNQAAKDLEDCNGTIQKLKEAAKTSDYQVEKLLSAVK